MCVTSSSAVFASTGWTVESAFFNIPLSAAETEGRRGVNGMTEKFGPFMVGYSIIIVPNEP